MAIDNPFANDVVKANKEENKKTQDKLQKAANLEVASKEEIKELKKIAKGTGEEAKEANKKLRAELAKTSNKKEAQKTLKQQEENLKENQKISGLSAKRIQKADILAQSITKQKKIMEEQRGKLEALGIDTATNKKFQKPVFVSHMFHRNNHIHNGFIKENSAYWGILNNDYYVPLGYAQYAEWEMNKSVNYRAGTFAW